jgi:outer membrane protein TolC
VVGALALALAPATRGQDRPPRPPETENLETIPIPVEAASTRRLELTVEQALELARRRNTAIAIRELDPAQARSDLRGAEAFFEPELFGSVGVSRSESVPQGLFRPTSETETFDGQVGWRQRVISGGLFELALAPGKFTQKQQSQFGRNDFRIWTADVSATYTQPLLRGGWMDYTLNGVRTAETAVAGATNRFERAVQDTLLEVVRAYWELVFARENYRVVAAARQLAQEQLRITEERIRVRELAERDRVSDEAEVAQRTEELIAAENEIYTREDALRRLLLTDEDGSMWTTAVSPASPIAISLAERDTDWREAAEEALRHRPDLQALRAEATIAELLLGARANELLPRLDFVGSYGTVGGDDVFNDALREAFDLDAPNWSLRVEWSVPIGNNAARAGYERARLELERTKRAAYAGELDVIREVREAVRQLRTLRERVRASLESVRLAETELDTARHKNRVGELTPFDVRLRNQSLLEARSRLLRNQLDYRVSEAQLRYVQGRLGLPETEEETAAGEKREEPPK